MFKNKMLAWVCDEGFLPVCSHGREDKGERAGSHIYQAA